MTREALLASAFAFILANIASIFTAVIFSIRHLINYNILLKDFETSQKDLNKVKQDVTQAHIKLRKLEEIITRFPFKKG